MVNRIFCSASLLQLASLYSGEPFNAMLRAKSIVIVFEGVGVVATILVHVVHSVARCFVARNLLLVRSLSSELGIRGWVLFLVL